jgi:hypothetical protein
MAASIVLAFQTLNSASNVPSDTGLAPIVPQTGLSVQLLHQRQRASCEDQTSEHLYVLRRHLCN